MKRMLTYFNQWTGDTLTADVENKIDRIVITIDKSCSEKYAGRSGEWIRGKLLRKYIPQYSKIDPIYKSDRTKLAAHLEDVIKEYQDEIEKLRLVIQLARKNKIEIQ